MRSKKKLLYSVTVLQVLINSQEIGQKNSWLYESYKYKSQKIEYIVVKKKKDNLKYD